MSFLTAIGFIGVFSCALPARNLLVYHTGIFTYLPVCGAPPAQHDFWAVRTILSSNFPLWQKLQRTPKKSFFPLLHFWHFWKFHAVLSTF